MESDFQEAYQEADQTESNELPVLAGYDCNFCWAATWNVLSLVIYWILREVQT